MTQWIQSSNTKQDGTPVTRAIKIPEMSEEIWFTTNAYAEVSQTVGDLLATEISSISKVSEPSSPGEYYGDAGENVSVKLVLADKSFNDLTITGTADIADVDAEQVSNISVPDPVDGQSGLEALDSTGATIYLRPNSTYLIDNPPLRFTSDDITIVGSRSSVIKVADNAIADNTGPNEMEFAGAGVSLRGWTFDGNQQNQGADDVYGIMFDTGAVNATISDMHNLNACGDGFGRLREGTTVTNCYLEDFTEDGLELWSQGEVQVSNCYAKGGTPLKIRNRPIGTIGWGTFSNCTFIGDGTPAVRIKAAESGTTVRDISFDSCTMTTTSGTSGKECIRLNGDFGTTAGGELINISLSDCHIYGGTNGVEGRQGVTLTDCAVENCRFEDVSTGILLHTGSGCSISQNQYAGNVTTDVDLRSGMGDTTVVGQTPNGTLNSGSNTRFAEPEAGIRVITPDMGASEVQRIIDELAADGGGTVKWEAGQFRYAQATTVSGEAAAIELKPNIEYVGQGYNTHIIQDEKDINLFATEYDDTAADNYAGSQVENVRIANLRLDGNKGAFSDFSTRQVNNVLWLPLIKDSVVENCWIHDVHQHGIHPDAAIDSTFRACHIDGCDGQGIHMASRNIDGTVYGPYDSTISNCLVENVAKNCISDGGTDTRGTRMIGNTLVGGTTGVSFGGKLGQVTGNIVIGANAGIDIGGSKVSVAGNISRDCNRGAIIKGSDIGVSSFVIDGTVDNHGLYIDTSTNVELSNVVVRDTTLRGLWIRNSTDITADNIMIDNAGDLGARVDSDCTRVTLGSPTFKNCANDGALLLAPGTMLSGNVVAENNAGTGIALGGDNSTAGTVYAANNNWTGFEIGGNDCSIQEARGSGNGNSGTTLAASGARPKVGGIIGGGLLNGVDIGSTTGARTNDLAIANGTTATNAYSLWAFNGTDWVRVDGGATITPA